MYIFFCENYVKITWLLYLLIYNKIKLYWFNGKQRSLKKYFFALATFNIMVVEKNGEDKSSMSRFYKNIYLLLKMIIFVIQLFEVKRF